MAAACAELYSMTMVRKTSETDLASTHRSGSIDSIGSDLTDMTDTTASDYSPVLQLGSEPGSLSIHDLFDIGDIIGRGAFGEVRKAVQRSTGSPVALKCIPRSVGEPSLAEMMGNELLRRTLDELIHPNIVRFYMFAEDQGSSYEAMTLLSGPPLCRYFGDLAPLSPRHAADVLAQSAAAVSFLHERCLVHRDLKPDNFVLEEAPSSSCLGTSGSDIIDRLPAGLVKLLDFGTVANAGQVVDEAVGSIGFCAPEVFKGWCIPAADAFSFGVMISIALTCSWPEPMQPSLWLELMEENDAGSVELYRNAIEDMDVAELKRWADEELPNHPEMADILSSLLSPSADARPSVAMAKQVFEYIRDGTEAAK